MIKLTKCLMLAVMALLAAAGTNPQSAQEEPLDDRDIKLSSFVDLPYPPLARAAAVQGVVVVKLKLDDAGNVASAFAISGSKALIQDVLANAKQWKFEPNAKKSAVLVYDFRIGGGACHDNTRSIFQLVHQNFASITTCSPVVNPAQ
jgi:TonB family protein